jgi:hypothetical protein
VSLPVEIRTSLTSPRSIVAVTGYAILLGLPVKGHAGALYFAVFLTVAASGPLIGTTIAWTANTWGNHCELFRLARPALS